MKNMKNKKNITGGIIASTLLLTALVPTFVSAYSMPPEPGPGSTGSPGPSTTNNITSSRNDGTQEKRTASLKLAEGDFILETSPIKSFGSHKIEKSKKTISAGFDKDFFVTDARGTQQGWTVTVSATPFTIVKPASGWVQNNPYSLPKGSLSLNNVTTLAGVYGEKTSVRPSSHSLGVAVDLGQAVKVVTANKGQGMGKHKFNFNATSGMSLVIDPKTAKIDKINYPTSVTPYESTITWNLISGPTT